jgi:hypothetical protein
MRIMTTGHRATGPSLPALFVALDFPLSWEQTLVHGATDSLRLGDSEGADYASETLRKVAGFF